MIELGSLIGAARRDNGDIVLVGDTGQTTFRCDDAVTAESLLEALTPLADLVTAHHMAARLARSEAEIKAAAEHGHSVRVDSTRLSDRLSPWRDENAARGWADHHFPRDMA